MGKRSRKTTFATIALELTRLIRLIRTLFVWLKLIGSLCSLVETTMHDSIIPLDVVEPSTLMCGERGQSVDVDKKFGHFKKNHTFTYGKYYNGYKTPSATSKNAIDTAAVHFRRVKSAKALGKRSRKTTFATIALELTRLIRLIRTLFVWLKLIGSLFYSNAVVLTPR